MSRVSPGDGPLGRRPRPLRRESQHQLEDPLAERLLQAEFGPGDKIVVDAGPDGKLTIAKKSPRKQPVKVGS